MRIRCTFPALFVLLAATTANQADDAKDGWIDLLNSKDTAGWKLRSEKITQTKYVDADGKVIEGAKKTKVDQKELAQDAKGRIIPGAKIETKGGKKLVLDAEGEIIKGAKVVKVGGRDAIVNSKGEELKDAKTVTETLANPNGWIVVNGELICEKPHGGNDLLTDKKFTDFELSIEFQATSNSGVYLQGRYEIQVDNSFGAKPTLVEKNGKKIETLATTQCGGIYGRIAPSKNMAKPAKEWQKFEVIFHGAKGDKDKVTQKARVTLIWNGEKVIDNAEIDGPTGSALDGKVTEPGPLLLQGDHGKVAYRNIKIRPIAAK